MVKSDADVATLFVGKTPLPAIRSTSIKGVGEYFLQNNSILRLRLTKGFPGETCSPHIRGCAVLVRTTVVQYSLKVAGTVSRSLKILYRKEGGRRRSTECILRRTSLGPIGFMVRKKKKTFADLGRKMKRGGVEVRIFRMAVVSAEEASDRFFLSFGNHL